MDNEVYNEAVNQLSRLISYRGYYSREFTFTKRGQLIDIYHNKKPVYAISLKDYNLETVTNQNIRWKKYKTDVMNRALFNIRKPVVSRSLKRNTNNNKVLYAYELADVEHFALDQYSSDDE